jgi:hypothetical protein
MTDQAKKETQIFRSGKRRPALIIGLIAAALGCLGCLGIAFTDPRPQPNELFLFGLSLGLPIVLLVGMTCLANWGEWRIDTEGIEFRHCWRRKPRYLAWQNVEQVHWCYLSFGLKAGRKKLGASWSWFPKPQIDQLRSCLESCLSKDFDLRHEEGTDRKAFSFELNFRSVSFWILRMLGVIVGGIVWFFAVMMGGIFLIRHYTDPHSLAGKILREWSAALAFLLFVPLLPWIPQIKREIKRAKRLYPYWRVRGARYRGEEPETA